MSATVDVYRGALEAVDRIVNRESEADEVLRKTVDVLHDRFDHYSWVGIYLVEGRPRPGTVEGPAGDRARADSDWTRHLRRRRGERRHGGRRRRERRRPLPRVLRLCAARSSCPSPTRTRCRRDRHRFGCPGGVQARGPGVPRAGRAPHLAALPRGLGHRRPGVGAVIKALDHLDLVVTSLERSQPFYQEPSVSRRRARSSASAARRSSTSRGRARSRPGASSGSVRSARCPSDAVRPLRRRRPSRRVRGRLARGRGRAGGVVAGAGRRDRERP